MSRDNNITMTKPEHIASLRGQLLAQNLELALSNLADAAMKIDELTQRVAELEKHRTAPVWATPAVPATTKFNDEVPNPAQVETSRTPL